MTDTTTTAGATEPVKRRGLTAMRLAELQDVAAGMGISGTATMRKGDLITAIRERQGGPAPRTRSVAAESAPEVAPEEKAAPRRSRRATTGVTTPEAAPARSEA
ncbi:MAG: Rho termination factor N-terminal domain-containing protein, partial [Mobilicoccus sp.]|nr:Rho termination factor N-terminal domain-containing protein [Mobilicoccus sp.]